ncbi:MAG: hypothetical protein SWH54_02945 [Thermodesulfobacteriota bacterium]|nr:hypothetical protein [Thermodesulfobacteriota bacterium]
MFHTGSELFERFNLSLESEIIYSDYSRSMIFVYRHAIKFTDKAILILYPAKDHGDWIEAESIDFSPWENIIGFQNFRGSDAIEEFSRPEIDNWLSTIPTSCLQYPFLYARQGKVAYIVEGVPKSAHSRKGKERLKQEVLKRKDLIQEYFGSPATGPVEIMIDIFSSDFKRLPDVDRASITIMDAFEGAVYENDKQVRHLQPRVFSSTSAFIKLECQTEPMEGYTVENITAGSLYPLATGVLDYYVVRINTYRS